MRYKSIISHQYFANLFIYNFYKYNLAVHYKKTIPSKPGNARVDIQYTHTNNLTSQRRRNNDYLR